MIIDIHTHLGDILYPEGGKLIYQTGVKKKLWLDMVSLSESGLHEDTPLLKGEWLYRLTYNKITKASRARNATATLENMQASMDRAGVTQTACMPIPPYLYFDDLARAKEQDSRIIPFTGIDYGAFDQMEPTLKDHVARGAMGLKLHPIIQNIPLNDDRTLQAVEAFAQFGLPILFHCGISSYYLGKEREEKENATYGSIQYAENLVAAFPQVKFIAGHAGLFQYQEVIDRLSSYQNVWVDISFQSPKHIQELIQAFGPDRVLFASDWPYGRRTTAVKAVKKACDGDTALEEALFFRNAQALLSLS